MSLDFLKRFVPDESPVVIRTTNTELIESVQQALGDDTPDRAQRIVESEVEVTEAHYKQWLDLIEDIASEQRVNLKNKSTFTDFAFEILDNDPMMDIIGGNNEVVKGRIVTILWQMFKFNMSKERAHLDMQRANKRAQEEEEAVLSLVGSETFPRQSIQMEIPATTLPAQTPGQTVATSNVDSILRQVVSSPTNVVADVVKQIEQEGNAAWASVTLPKNPHPVGSAAYKAWIKGLVNGAKATLGIQDKPAATKKKPSRRK